MMLPEPLPTQVTVLLYTVATAAFLGTAVKAVRNYRRTKGISNYWLIFGIAIALGATVTAANLLVSLGIYPVLLDALDQWIALLFIFTLIMTAIETLTSPITVTIE